MKEIEEMADIAKFFEALSERAYKENDLSDVTYAMCGADVKFRQFFLDFFFKDAHLDASKVTIEREHSEANGRPDFWIKDEEGIGYIVEVKIWDGNHHFEQYYDILDGRGEAEGNKSPIGDGNVELAGKKVWGWMGARYTDKGAVVCVEFEDMTGWGRSVCDCYKGNVKGGTLRFYAKDSASVATSAGELDKFFCKVISAVQNSVNLCAEDDVYCMSEAYVRNYSTLLLSMKCLPFTLENHFIDEDFAQKMAECGYEFAFVYGNDQEIPDSHCGRYFELRKKSEDNEAGNRTIYCGWIGVDFNSSCCKDKNREDSGTYWDAPVFLIEISKDLPAAESLPENSWGWRCVELGEKKEWKLAFAEAKDKMLKLVSKKSEM